MNVEIRRVVAADIPYLVRLSHTVESTHVWRPVWPNGEGGEVIFRPARLPRPIRLEYPYPPERLTDEWRHRPAVWVALRDGVPVGYAALTWAPTPDAVWVSDLVVDEPWRRQGIGRALLHMATRWAAQRGFRRLVLPSSFRNHPAITLAYRARLRFVGFQYGYFPNGDTAIFLGREV